MSSLIAVMCLTLPVSARALQFTLASSVFFSGGNNAEGFLLPAVLDLAGTPELTSGSVNLVIDDVFVFQVLLCKSGDVGPCSGQDSGDVDLVTITVMKASFFSSNPKGTGSFDLGASFEAPSEVVNNPGFFSGEFEFDLDHDSAANLEAGETSDKLFVTFSAGELAAGTSVTFMLQSGTAFSVVGTVIPEPSAGLLFSSLLVCAGLTRSRYRSHSRVRKVV